MSAYCGRRQAGARANPPTPPAQGRRIDSLSPMTSLSAPRRIFAGLTGYQWLVLFAAWLGWGFDVFDGLLFNNVAPVCVPNLLGLQPGSPEALEATTYWTGALTSALLIGWGLGGIVFGKVADQLGRTRTLLLTMLTYALATAACAAAPNLYVLAGFRFVASLGIGGEWAAGASLVAETVPEDRRAFAGALLYTSSPAGILLAGFVNDVFSRQIVSIASDPGLSWRIVFLTGLVPAAFAILIRLLVKEPARWTEAKAEPRVRELFAPALRRRTLGGLAMSAVALITWWSCNAFIGSTSKFLARSAGHADAGVQWNTTATYCFALGGLLGTLATVPIANRLGRRPMFLSYFAASAVAIWLTFAFDVAPHTRLYLFGLIGLTVFGIFGSFTFYLPELFPTRLRGTGAGFCYNSGRFVTALFPVAIGALAKVQPNPLLIIRWVALVPLIGAVLVLVGVAEETRGRRLA
jgi:MFS family permease